MQFGLLWKARCLISNNTASYFYTGKKLVIPNLPLVLGKNNNEYKYLHNSCGNYENINICIQKADLFLEA